MGAAHQFIFTLAQPLARGTRGAPKIRFFTGAAGTQPQKLAILVGNKSWQ
jgi:hypothetical protein